MNNDIDVFRFTKIGISAEMNVEVHPCEKTGNREPMREMPVREVPVREIPMKEMPVRETPARRALPVGERVTPIGVHIRGCFCLRCLNILL